jgi:hypothetical protein
VPLSARAEELLRARWHPGVKPTEAVWPGRGSRFLRINTLNQIALQKLENGRWRAYTCHGSVRAGLKTWAVEDTGHTHNTIERALAHSVRTTEGQVAATYNRGDLLKKRRDRMSDWADYCLGVVANAA